MKIETYSYSGTDFWAAKSTGTWKIGFLRASRRFTTLGFWERHLLTDEMFVLLGGTATLYTKDKSGITPVPMRQETVYNIPREVWHHIIVSTDATVLVIENSDTCQENTEKIFPESQEEPTWN